MLRGPPPGARRGLSGGSPSFPHWAAARRRARDETVAAPAGAVSRPLFQSIGLPMTISERTYSWNGSVPAGRLGGALGPRSGRAVRCRLYARARRHVSAPPAFRPRRRLRRLPPAVTAGRQVLGALVRRTRRAGDIPGAADRPPRLGADTRSAVPESALNPCARPVRRAAGWSRRIIDALHISPGYRLMRWPVECRSLLFILSARRVYIVNGASEVGTADGLTGHELRL